MFFIVGPTAVGKTEIAAEVAARLDAEIISADAFQIYAGLDIMTGKPEAALHAKARHHLIGEVPLSQAFDVAQFAARANERALEIAKRGKLALVVGGTGLHARALSRGLSDLPGANSALRAELEAQSLAGLRTRYAELDPAGARQIDLKNKRRLVRAIEVTLLTGKPFSSFRDEWTKTPKYPSGFFLLRDRADLSARIDARVEQMFKQGLLEEARSVTAIGPTAARVIGWREAQACLRGEISEAEAIAKIQLATRRYAKRQLTWFRREPNFEPLNLTNLPSESAIEMIVQKARSLPAAPNV